MDHKNKIQLLVLPTEDPGEAPDYITEYGHCTCEYGRICHKSANFFQNKRFPYTRAAFSLPGAAEITK